ncbi:hypothetical protein Hanom_Chr17g01551521 [Helianthus anomalus]
MRKDVQALEKHFVPLFATKWAVFYRSKTRVCTFRGIFESFYRGQYIASNGIHAFVDVLNLEEKKRDRKSSPYKLFLFSTMMDFCLKILAFDIKTENAYSMISLTKYRQIACRTVETFPVNKKTTFRIL